MNIDVTKCVAEIVATSFDADRPALRRYSVTVVLHSPERYPTYRCTGYGEDQEEARHNAIGEVRTAVSVGDVPVAAGNLPDGYGRAYLADEYLEERYTYLRSR